MSHGPLRILMVVHGFPPREVAGTERHVADLAAGLHARGHRVEVFAATRDPAARQYALSSEQTAHGQVHRLVQNMPTRPLDQAEVDRAAEAALDKVVAELRPDLVHVHHVQFLSSGMRFSVPTILTLHDQWLWCAAGGLGVRVDGSICPGPDAQTCATCAAAWAPRPGTSARALLALAGRTAGRIQPSKLHALFDVVPAPVRRRIQAPRRGSAPEPAAAARARNDALRDLAGRAALRLAPSQDLADRAVAAGLGPVQVLPNGTPPCPLRTPPDQRRGPLLFLGTVAAHKGPDLVVAAWRRAFPDGQPGLAIHGQVQAPALLDGHVVGPVLDRQGVQQALQSARALVMGSRWPENAPLVVLEARAAGCPVIAPRIGGLPELVQHGRDGWLYPPGDEAALAAAMAEAVARPLPQLPALPPTVQQLVEAVERHYRDVTAAAALADAPAGAS